MQKKRDSLKQSITPHVVVPLTGWFKGDTGESNVMLVLAEKTKSRFLVSKWVKRLI